MSASEIDQRPLLVFSDDAIDRAVAFLRATEVSDVR